MAPSDFFNLIAPAAKSSSVATGIYASFTMAEAALESGWGESGLAKTANNYFGVKADPSWTGDTVSIPTKEYLNEQWVTVEAQWRKYPDLLSCLSDHAQFLLDNPRYQPAFATNNVNDFTNAIAAAGYATDPQYAQKIMEIINFHNLTTYDGS